MNKLSRTLNIECQHEVLSVQGPTDDLRCRAGDSTCMYEIADGRVTTRSAIAEVVELSTKMFSLYKAAGSRK
jgi:hypothetical protein